jgi:AhpD family alkylhydroperoxidase
MTVRPAILESGHRRRARLFLGLVQRLTRQRIDPVVRMALYRPRFFGAPFLGLTAEVMRGPSFWTAAEREYLAAFTSRLNECPFCARIHTETGRVESGAGAGPLRPAVAAVVPLLEKLTRTPEQVTRSDVDAVRAAGVPDEAIADAFHINLVFNVVNRLANAFDFAWDSDEQVRLAARVIHRIRYRLPRVLMR